MTATPSPRPARPGFGPLLKEWRSLRGTSQLDLALGCGISQRHLSFLESGRARPSRSMVLHLAAALAVPLRDQNALLLAAGFAPAFGPRPLDAPEMQAVNKAIDHALAKQEPYPALLVDEGYTVLRANQAAMRLVGFLLAPHLPPADQPLNVVHMLLSPGGAIREVMENWEETAAWMVRRLRAEAQLEGRRAEIDALIAGAMGSADLAVLAPLREETTGSPTLELRFAKDGVRLRLFTMIATLGTPLDASLQGLRLEFLYPADDATDAWFAQD